MNCGNYQNLISAYLDGELDEDLWSAVEVHMESCVECSEVFADFNKILQVCDDSFSQEALPPNSNALWCRINNVIECEDQVSRTEVVGAPARGWVSRFWHESLNLSTLQIASSVAGIALVSSLLTVVAFKNLTTPSDPLATDDSQPTVFEKVLGQLGVGETAIQRNDRRLKEQRAAIDYWRNRVEARRATWNVETRLVFDRNLSEIEKAVTEYSRLLRENPDDAISNEMLDSALKEKMELLREFSEL